MNTGVAALVAGMVLLVVGGQGLVRVLVDHADEGLLAWLPGGFAGALAGYVVLVAAGLGLAAAGDRRRR